MFIIVIIVTEKTNREGAFIFLNSFGAKWNIKKKNHRNYAYSAVKLNQILSL